MNRPLGRIVIVGGGTAGWIAAAMLARFVQRQTRITLVESDAIGTVGVGEATIPQIRLLFSGLGLDEAKLLAATEGTIKFGIEFDGWQRPGHRYMHAFGTIGRGLGVVPFYHYWLRGRAEGIAAPLADYIPSAVAARGTGTAAEHISHAFHLDASLLAALLRRVAEAGGVERIEGSVAAIERGETGDIAALRLDGDRCVDGDFFLDCTGFRALLIGRALGVGFDDWSHWLPCDRALAVASARREPLLPYTRAIARSAGWQWRIPLRHRTGNGLVYSSAHLSEDEACAQLLANVDGDPLADPRPLRFLTGKRKRFWERNVIAIGLASGFMEPLESTSIHMIQSAIARLLELFPAAGGNGAARDAYNAQTDQEYDRIRDFLILHYHANSRDEPFWRDRRNANLPQELTEKLRQWREGARIVQHGHELFTEPGWVQLLIGQDFACDRWSTLADGLTSPELHRFLDSAVVGRG